MTQYGEQGRTRRPGVLWWIGGLAVLALSVAAFAGSRNRGTDTAPIEASTYSKVIYKLSGTARTADITIETPSGSSQQNGVDVPLISKSTGTPGLEFTFSSGSFVYLSAQNDDAGDLTCSIETPEGAIISQNTSSGFAAIATCKGTAP